MKTYEKVVEHFKKNAQKTKKSEDMTGPGTYYYLDGFECYASDQEHGPVYFFGPNGSSPSSEYLATKYGL